MVLTRLFGLKSLLVVLVFFCVWVRRAWSWQESFRLPSAEEFVTDFFLLPVLVCVALWLLKKMIGYLIKPRIQPTADGNHNEPEEQIPESVGYLDIRDVEFRLPVGCSPDDVVRALKQRDLPGFHYALKTSDGSPVRAAWIQNVMTADFAEIGSSRSSLETTVERALLLALDALQSIALRHVARGDSKAALQIHFLAPARWGTRTVEAAEQWLGKGFASSMPPSVQFHLSVQSVTGAIGALKYLNKLITQVNYDLDDAGHLLLVSDSFIGEIPVARWDKQGRLYATERPEGLIPGEGACALLLGAAPTTDSDSSFARVQQVDIRQCYPSANKDADPLCEMLGQRDGIRDGVGTVISDSSHRAVQQTEVAAMQHAFFPGLHPIKNNLALTAGCGEMAAVAPIASLALAAHLSVRLQINTLMVSVQDDGWRAATLVHPPSVEAQPAHDESV
ncbi:hypothetical protein NPS29_27850 [Pseudomonas putida]|uniref:hypothetical protein n=1 Tax=Pseudomonas putida TaxID=303 RepID=UPI002363C4D1|nr:hypothetical protein [Pseudomonas putida]MDD1969155.1 hypothetical protein [Pseudomonas putida]